MQQICSQDCTHNNSATSLYSFRELNVHPDGRNAGKNSLRKIGSSGRTDGQTDLARSTRLLIKIGNAFYLLHTLYESSISDESGIFFYSTSNYQIPVSYLGGVRGR